MCVGGVSLAVGSGVGLRMRGLGCRRELRAGEGGWSVGGMGFGLGMGVLGGVRNKGFRVRERAPGWGRGLGCRRRVRTPAGDACSGVVLEMRDLGCRRGLGQGVGGGGLQEGIWMWEGTLGWGRGLGHRRGFGVGGPGSTCRDS